ncbi:MAG: antibiotic biosynthesis monooxygenase [Pontimonas sp.]
MVIALIRPLQDQSVRVREHLEAVIPAVHEESGCEFYALHESSDGTLIFVEAWDSRQQWVDHIEGPTVAEMTRRLEGLLAAPTEVHEVYGVPAGNTLRGVIPEGSG